MMVEKCSRKGSLEMSDMVKIALDAMGGDNAPSEIIKGMVEAWKKADDIYVYLVGQEDVVKAELEKYEYDNLYLVDMFPRTNNVESVAILSLSEVSKYFV